MVRAALKWLHYLTRKPLDSEFCKNCYRLNSAYLTSLFPDYYWKILDQKTVRPDPGVAALFSKVFAGFVLI